MHVKAGMMPSELSVSVCVLDFLDVEREGGPWEGREDTVLSSTPSSCGDFHRIAEKQETILL